MNSIFSQVFSAIAQPYEQGIKNIHLVRFPTKETNRLERIRRLVFAIFELLTPPLFNYVPFAIDVICFAKKKYSPLLLPASLLRQPLKTTKATSTPKLSLPVPPSTQLTKSTQSTEWPQSILTQPTVRSPTNSSSWPCAIISYLGVGAVVAALIKWGSCFTTTTTISKLSSHLNNSAGPVFDPISAPTCPVPSLGSRILTITPKQPPSFPPPLASTLQGSVAPLFDPVFTPTYPAPTDDSSLFKCYSDQSLCNSLSILPWRFISIAVGIVSIGVIIAVVHKNRQQKSPYNNAEQSPLFSAIATATTNSSTVTSTSTTPLPEIKTTIKFAGKENPVTLSITVFTPSTPDMTTDTRLPAPVTIFPSPMPASGIDDQPQHKSLPTTPTPNPVETVSSTPDSSANTPSPLPIVISSSITSMPTPVGSNQPEELAIPSSQTGHTESCISPSSSASSSPTELTTASSAPPAISAMTISIIPPPATSQPLPISDLNPKVEPLANPQPLSFDSLQMAPSKVADVPSLLTPPNASPPKTIAATPPSATTTATPTSSSVSTSDPSTLSEKMIKEIDSKYLSANDCRPEHIRLLKKTVSPDSRFELGNIYANILQAETPTPPSKGSPTKETIQQDTFASNSIKYYKEAIEKKNQWAHYGLVKIFNSPILFAKKDIDKKTILKEYKDLRLKGLSSAWIHFVIGSLEENNDNALKAFTEAEKLANKSPGSIQAFNDFITVIKYEQKRRQPKTSAAIASPSLNSQTVELLDATLSSTSSTSKITVPQSGLVPSAKKPNLQSPTLSQPSSTASFPPTPNSSPNGPKETLKSFQNKRTQWERRSSIRKK